MKAMIFAAGLGTRLRPLTNDRPKAMVEIHDMPLLEIQIRRLKALGFRKFVVNVHHFGQMVIDFLAAKDHFGVEIQVSDERDLLLDTGGGLKKAAEWLDGQDPFFVCNVDVVTDLNPQLLMDAHRKGNALATLALRDRSTSRYLLWDEEMRLCGWKNIKTGEVKGNPGDDATPLAFSGMQVISPELFPLMEQEGVFSIIDVYLDLMKTGRIKGLRHDDTLWMDVGKPPELKKAEEIIDQVIV